MFYLNDCVDRLNALPPETSKHLRSIQQLDKQVERIQSQMNQKQKQFLEKLKQHRGKKIDNRAKQQLETEYKDILQIYKNCISLATQKVFHLTNQVRIACMLYDLVHEPTEKMDVQLNKMKIELKKTNQFEQQEDRESNVRRRRGKERRKAVTLEMNVLKGQQLNKNEPVYCYCGRPSFGVMVMCENSLCERQWFHQECITEKNLPDKWYCNDCRKVRDKKHRRNGGNSYL